MGAWGPGIFSDDLACDVRDDYVKQLILGKTSEEATEIVKKKFPIEELTSDDAPVFWISLALTQWKKGRLLPEVRDEAIRQIDSGTDLERWEDSTEKVLEKRKTALLKAKETLLSEMPPAKKVPIPFWMRDDPWQAGDVLSYKIIREDIPFPECYGKYVILRVIEMQRGQDDGPMRAYYGVYNWSGDELPDLGILENLEFMKLYEYDKGTPKHRYYTHRHILIDKKDMKERDIRLIRRDPNFKISDYPIFEGDRSSGVLGGPSPFDAVVSECLHKYDKRDES